MTNGVNQRLDELKTVLDQSLNLRKQLLLNAAANVRTWSAQARKMKGIYHTMNMLNYDQKSAIAECWTPVCEITRIRDALDKESVISYLFNRSHFRSGSHNSRL
jgi:V-type H+-transporting ATPase subunit a